MLAFIEEVTSACALDDFPRHLLTALEGLVAADSASYNEVDVARRRKLHSQV